MPPMLIAVHGEEPCAKTQESLLAEGRLRAGMKRPDESHLSKCLMVHRRPLDSFGPERENRPGTGWICGDMPHSSTPHERNDRPVTPEQASGMAERIRSPGKESPTRREPAGRGRPGNARGQAAH